MNPLVSDKCGVHTETLATISTGVRSLSRVCSLVNEKVRALGECFPTVSANVRPLTPVGSLMSKQARALSEGLPTLTHIGPLASVYSLMHNEVGLAVEALLTSQTLETFFGRTFLYRLAEKHLYLFAEVFNS